VTPVTVVPYHQDERLPAGRLPVPGGPSTGAVVDAVRRISTPDRSWRSTSPAHGTPRTTHGEPNGWPR
jgi:hypothetical protein